MCKLLLVTNNGIVSFGLSYLIKNKIKEVELDIVRSYNEMELKLAQNQYNILIIGMPLNNQPALQITYLLLKAFPQIAVFLFCENSSFLPFQQLYMRGVRCIVDKRATIEEINKAIAQIHGGGYYVNNKMLAALQLLDTNLVAKLVNGRKNDIPKLVLENKENIQFVNYRSCSQAQNQHLQQ